MGSDELAVLIEEPASLSEHGVEIIDGLEVSVDDRLIDEGPEVFGRLQLG